MKASPLSFVALFVWLLTFPARLLADWPEFRGNQQRTAYREQALPQNWQAAWFSSHLAAPTPAWPAPAQGSLWQKLDSVEPRVTDDRGYVPLLASDTSRRLHLLVASSTSDRLLSLNPQTGGIRWQFVADAPLRYAPSVRDGMAYFGADDGCVRAVDLQDGRVLWTTRVGPTLPLVVGNSRVISPHPIRTSVLATEDAIYANAGLFPSQGVYSVALDRTNGQPLWRRRTQRSPQGYLLRDLQQRLVIPCGRATPYLIDRQTGRFLSECQSQGGTFAMVTTDAFFSGPGNASEVQSYPNLPESKMLPLSGRAVAAGDGRLWSADETTIRCFDLKRLVTRQPAAQLWSIAGGGQPELIVSGNDSGRFLYAAAGNRLRILDASSGAELQTLPIADDGHIQHIAVSAATDGPAVLTVSTSDGRLFCWQAAVSDLPETTEAKMFAPAPRDATPVRATKTSHKDTNDVTDQLDQALARLPSPRGFGLLIGDESGEMAEHLLAASELQLVSCVSTADLRDRLRRQLLAAGRYGGRICVLHAADSQPLPFTERIFNLVSAAADTRRSSQQLQRLVTGGGVLFRSGHSPTVVRHSTSGAWRHLYGNPANTADSGDAAFAGATTFRLQWFGGVGPSRIPDRHLRAHAPLASGTSLILHGDDYLIGVDPANGTERWQKRLPPDATRYVIPLDSGYSCLTTDGRNLYTATADHILQLNAGNGEQISAIDVPDDVRPLRWGYLAEADGRLFASCMKRTAPRVKTDETSSADRPSDTAKPQQLSRATIRDLFVDQDYDSGRPLVCSRLLMCLAADHQPHWRYASGGVIANSAISLSPDGRRLVFVEGRTAECQSHPTDRLPVRLIARDAWLVCLDTETGKPAWERRLHWERAQNMLYTQIADGKVIVSTSNSIEKQGATYNLQVFELTDGTDRWSAQHAHVTDGLGHGEQIHHPLVLQQSSGQLCLFAEPYLYDLSSGDSVSPTGQSDWVLRRPGHSCGTISGAGDCVFFRASNPTVLSLSSGTTDEQRFQKLSPSRPSCWINMLPVDGRLLIPEGSASCVCLYPLQTSMAFAPASAADLPLLPDFPKLEDVEPARIYSWRFDNIAPGRSVRPATGSLPLVGHTDIQMDPSGIMLDGDQWLAVPSEQTPLLPETITLEARLTVAEGTPPWTGIVGAIQDNGDHERGSLLGIHEGRFFLAIAAESKSRLTYLEASQQLEFDRAYHVLGTYDGSLMRLYIDGRLVAVSRAQSGPVLYDAASRLTVGIYKDKNDHYPLVGSVAEAAIYRGALSTAEVKARAAETSPQ